MRAAMMRIFLAAAALTAATAARADDLVARGEYLTRAADCAGCHTVPGGAMYAGGRAFTLPMGTVWSPNITPDPTTGIGGYSDDDWLKALQKGVARDGRHLYPAMPYAAYTRMSREDALAIKAYLFSLKPAATRPTPAATMKFPYDQRWGLTFWNLVNAPNRRLEPDTSKSAAWNRGAYLVEALGHCGECHTPRNFMQGLKGDKAFAGANQQGWLAYNISSDKEAGIGGWSDEQLASYLSTGQAPGRGPASGPMAEVVQYSLRYLTQDDIKAIVAYLRDRPAQTDGPPAVQGMPKAVASSDPAGAGLYNQACAGCHLPDGKGRQVPWAALGGSHTAGDVNGTNLVQVLAHGAQMETAQGLVFMHSFTGGYSNAELATIANYTIGQMSGREGKVTAQQIGAARGNDAHKPTDPPPQVAGLR
jgi:mono/diheme cytochrome c family protein